MNRIVSALSVAGMAIGIVGLTAVSVSAEPTVLFADTFDRADNTDLNASTSGKSGTLGALTYGEKVSSGGMEIAGNLLKGGDNGAAAGWAIAYINDHNFVDGSLRGAGGFSISIDLVQYTTAGSSRHMSIGVGQSLAELSGASGKHGNSDLLVGYRWTTTDLEIYTNAVLDSTTDITAYSVPQTMKIDYSFTDFNAGSAVNYDVYLISGATNLIKSGSFKWSGTDENYISIHSNLSGLQARFDNFEISADIKNGTVLVVQ